MSKFKEGDHKRDAGGEFTAGGGGGGTTAAVSASPSRAFGEYLRGSGGDAYNAARSFYKAELQGKHVAANMGSLGGKEVHFTATGLKKMQQNMKNEPTKPHLVPHLASVIADGKYLGETAPHKDRSDFVSFHHFQKKVDVGGKAVNVIVDVGRKPDGQYEFSAYSLAHSDSPRFAAKKEGLRGAGLRVEDTKQGAAPDKGELSQSLGANALSCKNKIIPTNRSVNVVTLDTATQRHTDANGFLHVAASPISKEQVAPYYGREVPGWEEAGLNPERLYHGYRPGAELEKAAHTFNGLPLMLRHHVVTPDQPEKEHQVGSLGTHAAFAAPYLTNALIITDATGIAAIESGTARELSAAYSYEPVFTPGTFEGQPYDFVMTRIQGNHVALVEEGRAGPDVVVADATCNPQPRGMFMTLKNLLRSVKRRVLSMDADPAAIEKAETAIEEAALAIQAVEAAEGGADADLGEDEDKDAKIKEILTLLGPDLDEETLKKVTESLRDLASSPAAPEGAATDEEETALDADEVKAALDKCGLDAESPEFQKAFAEGVTYGKEKEKPAPGQPARDQESEGAKKALDAALRHARRTPALAADAARAMFRDLNAAARAVRPLIGDIPDPLAFDSANDIYGKALDAAGISRRAYPKSAWRGMVDVLVRQKASAAMPSMPLATDAKTDPITAQLGRIRVEG